MLKYILSSFLVVAIVMMMFPQNCKAYNSDLDTQTEVSSLLGSVTEVELIDPSNDNEYMLLMDTKVVSELLDDNTVKITLTNIGAFVMTDWTVAYEAAYDVLEIENAELVSGSEVVEFKSIDANKTLNSGESTSITLTINGVYFDNTNYRVYGLCDGVQEYYSVADFISYDASTGKITLDTFDIEDAQADLTGSVYTKGTEMDFAGAQFDSGVSPNTVIGSDGRTLVTSVSDTPYNRIACLIITWSDGSKSQGTGFMISSKYMLTAAHCVYNTNLGEAATSITAYFGANGSSYSKSVSASSWSWCASYPSDTSAKNDWGCIELSSAPGRGYFSIGYTTTATLESSELTVCGYPGDKASASSSATVNGKLRYMYMMTDTPSYVGSYVIEYTIDTYNGQSGSPVYNSSNVVYGIHNKGFSTYNQACRLTAVLVNAFVDYGWCNY